jgi:hypothetical protein
MLTFEVRGARLDLADELEEEFAREAGAAVKDAASHLLEHVRAQLEKRSGPEHAPPGEPPAKQTGVLQRSFRVMPVRTKGRYASSGVHSDHPGAARLEWGKTDRRGIRTFPHPYLEPAKKAAAPGITAILERLVRR